MSEEIKVGTVVQRISGGPKMCMHAIDGEQVTTTWWDDESRDFKRQTFRKEQIGGVYAFN